MHDRRAAGHATGAQADSHFARDCFAIAGFAAIVGGLRVLRGKKITKQVGNVPGPHVAVDDVVDLHHGRQHAAAKAGHLFDGEQALGVGVLSGGDLQVRAQRAVDRLRAADMTGRANAGLDDVAADGFVAEEMVERRNPGHGGGLDVRDLAKPLQRGGREPVPTCLHRLQKGDQVTRRTTDAGDHRVHFRHVHRRRAGLATARVVFA